MDGSVGLEEGQLEAAVSGVIYEEIEEAKTVAAAANQALLHHLRRVSSSFSKLVPLHARPLSDICSFRLTFFPLLLSFSLSPPLHTHYPHPPRDLLDKVSKVTIPDLQRVGKQYFSLLLEPPTTSTAICCNPSKVPEVKAGLEK